MRNLCKLEEAGQALPEAGLIFLKRLVLDNKGTKTAGYGYKEYKNYCQFYRVKEAPEATLLRMDYILFTYH